jgi:hypothetical protein
MSLTKNEGHMNKVELQVQKKKCEELEYGSSSRVLA